MEANEKTPRVSLVMAAWSGANATRECLQAIGRVAADVEIIVATSSAPDDVNALGRDYPGVRFIRRGRNADAFKLRSAGAAAARGIFVAMTEDHCRPTPRWLDALSGNPAEGRGKAGDLVAIGPVCCFESATARDRAVFLCEYAEQCPPIPEGTRWRASAVNACYPRAGLQACRAVWRERFHDNEVEDALRRLGYRVELEPEAVVSSAIRLTFLVAAAHLFRGGLRFGAYRQRGASGAARVGWLIAAWLVPLVLLGRILRTAITRRIFSTGALAASLPFVVALILSWSAGEALGYVAGFFSGGSETKASNAMDTRVILDSSRRLTHG